MMNHYDRERMAQAHRQELLREAAQERLLAQLPQPEGRPLRIPLQLKLSWRTLRLRLRPQHGF